MRGRETRSKYVMFNSDVEPILAMSIIDEVDEDKQNWNFASLVIILLARYIVMLWKT